MIGCLHRVFISDATVFGDSKEMSLFPNVWVRPFNQMSDKSFGMSGCVRPGTSVRGRAPILRSFVPIQEWIGSASIHFR
jgi:hypothetical protein